MPEVLMFELDETFYGVASADVREVLRAVTLSALPEAPDPVAGAINLRGQLVPVLDLRKLFGRPPKAIEHTDHLIVLEADARAVAICADRALDLLRLADHDLEQAEQSLQTGRFVGQVAKTRAGFVHLLDTTRLVAQIRGTNFQSA